MKIKNLKTKLATVIIAIICIAALTSCSEIDDTLLLEYESKIATLETQIKGLQEEIEEKDALIEAKDQEYVDTRFTMFDPTKLEMILRELQSNSYYEKLSYEELTNAVCAAYLDSLEDPYASFYSAQEWNDQTSATYKGIGVQVVFDTMRGAVQVITPFPNTPADKAGILPGDYIVAVEGTPVVDLDSAVALIRGEVGTSVTITIERNGKQFDVTMERAEVENVSIMYHTIEATATTPKTGYIKILEFNGTDSTTALQFLEAVKACEEDGVEAYIFDVRYCPGGDLYSVLNIINFVLPVQDNDLLANIDYTTADSVDIAVTSFVTQYWLMIIGDRSNISNLSNIDISNKPMVVLTNESTASGGELFASAIKDYAALNKVNATLLGTQTFGKGIMQTIATFEDGTAFKMTSAYYNPPYSDNYHGVGITPDIVVELDEALKDKNIYKITDEEDNQIQAALSHLAGELK